MGAVRSFFVLVFAWFFLGWQPAWSQSRVAADSLTVYVFLHDECKITQYYTPELNRLAAKYNDRHVGFIGIFPNASASAERIKAFGHTYGVKFLLLPDHHQEITRHLGATITPEVVVEHAGTGRLIYRGRIDDSYVRVGKRKFNIQHHDLEDIIEKWLNYNRPDQIIETPAIGCFITFTDSRN